MAQNMYAGVCSEVLTPATSQYIRQCTASGILYSSKNVIQYSSVIKEDRLRKMALDELVTVNQFDGFPEAICLKNTPEITAKALCALRALQSSNRISCRFNKDAMTEKPTAAEFAEVTEVLKLLNKAKEFSVQGDAEKAELIKTNQQKIPVMDAHWNYDELNLLKEHVKNALDQI
eukprot:Gregarina_sp_Poly_1__9927@NODE_652_length_6929_cov_76_457010_g495_i0_p3_GENE_NODE_652_length_6929_cov_76_457010_g495_i0NODE_652_length_6929_cov_76_457010_g495_i0_p3_ORF_typecomplete_len175_score25_00_NODE_652_length_6929_cov_76_457010_g495_i030083532